MIRKLFYLSLVTFFLVAFQRHLSAQSEAMPLLNPEFPAMLPFSSTVAPELGCWFFREADYPGKGERNFLDTVGPRHSFGLFLTAFRAPEETTDAAIHDMLKKAVEDGRKKYGLEFLLDLDVRTAKKAFAEKYPKALQEKLVFVEKLISFETTIEIPFEVASELSDHYTGSAGAYTVRTGRFLKAWSYSKNEKGEIIPESIRPEEKDIEFVTEPNGKARLRFTSKNQEVENPKFICGAVAFSYLYPDVFAPELISFEKELAERYADVPAVGTWKDEWGFPPCFDGNPPKNEYWYSETMRQDYAKRFSGRDLVDDCFLMFLPRQGNEKLRRDTIDDFNRLCLEKHVQIETEFVKTGKEVFGPKAFPATHPTWWPWPDSREFMKNQLSWWKVPREYAQTDECVPYYCRTSLAKGTNSVWYNMFYSTTPDGYVSEHWAAVLAGGRVNIHPIYPANNEPFQTGYRLIPILDTGVDQARSKIRLLDLITSAPLDCPVAVVFGHFGAMNWARPEYDKVGDTAIELCNALARTGYPSDLTPSSQADSGLWTRDPEGYLCYGPQKYAAVVFFGVSDSDRKDFEAIRTIAGSDTKTKMIELPALSETKHVAQVAMTLSDRLQQQGIEPQTAWGENQVWGNYILYRPTGSGHARLLDGTHLWTSTEKKPAGDEFHLENTTVDGRTFSASACGLFACRFGRDGTLQALAAGALQKFEGGGVSIDLRGEPTDITLRKNVDGTWSGVIQANENRIPSGLEHLRSVRWQFLERPKRPVSQPKEY